MGETVSPMCVLLIDNEKTFLEVLGMLLEKRGYEVISVSSVQGALIMWNLHKKRIRVVISDTWLSPTESTTELLNGFKKELPQMPILVTSGYLGEVEATKKWDTCAINYIPKPFDPLLMFEALDQLVTRGQTSVMP